MRRKIKSKEKIDLILSVVTILLAMLLLAVYIFDL